MISGRAVSDAEDLVQSLQRAEVTTKTIVQAWNQIVETPDEILVDLISETTESICGFKPEPELVEQFLLRRVHALNDAPDGSPLLELSRETNAPAAKRTRREGQGLHSSDHSGPAELCRLPARFAKRQASVAGSVVQRWSQRGPPLGRLTHEAVIECHRQPEKQAGISSRNLAEKWYRQPAGKR